MPPPSSRFVATPLPVINDQSLPGIARLDFLQFSSIDLTLTLEFTGVHNLQLVSMCLERFFYSYCDPYKYIHNIKASH